MSALSYEQLKNKFAEKIKCYQATIPDTKNDKVKMEALRLRQECGELAFYIGQHHEKLGNFNKAARYYFNALTYSADQRVQDRLFTHKDNGLQYYRYDAEFIRLSNEDIIRRHENIFIAGLRYYAGIGVCVNKSRAVKLFNNAEASQVNAANFMLGHIYLKDEAFVAQREMALSCLESVKDNMLAPLYLGQIYAKQTKLSKAEKSFEQACQLGSVDALLSVAELANDEWKQLACYRLAAQLGHARAQYHMAMHYIDKNEAGYQATALKWFLRAAEQNEPNSIANLVEHYKNHYDSVNFLKWCQRMAELGYKSAQREMFCISRGDYPWVSGGLSLQQGTAWLVKAAEGGDRKSMSELAMFLGPNSPLYQNPLQRVIYLARSFGSHIASAEVAFCRIFEFLKGDPDYEVPELFEGKLLYHEQGRHHLDTYIAQTLCYLRLRDSFPKSLGKFFSDITLEICAKIEALQVPGVISEAQRDYLYYKLVKTESFKNFSAWDKVSEAARDSLASFLIEDAIELHFGGRSQRQLKRPPFISSEIINLLKLVPAVSKHYIEAQTLLADFIYFESVARGKSKSAAFTSALPYNRNLLANVPDQELLQDRHHVQSYQDPRTLVVRGMWESANAEKATKIGFFETIRPKRSAPEHKVAPNKRLRR